MATLTELIIDAELADRILTDIDLGNLLNKTSAARYGLVNKAVRKGELIKIRRGLYVMANKYRSNKLSKLYLASRILPHSYISMESAMSYYGWIPERVATITSIHAGTRTKKFVTPFGEFVFDHLQVDEYKFLHAVKRIEITKGEPFLIATPLRALADFIYIKKVNWQGIDYLTSGLRIELENLTMLSRQDFLEVENLYCSNRVTSFLSKLKRELNK